MRTARFLQQICERADVSIFTARRAMRITTAPLRDGKSILPRPTTNVNFMLGETRILSNQGGYPHEHGVGYDPWMVVEVGPELERSPATRSAER